MEKDVLLTQEGYEKLQEELEVLSTDKRREVADRIREAREFGDISENSEYDDAKNEQAMLEKQIAKLEERLRSARVIDPSEADRRRRGRRARGHGQGRGSQARRDVPHRRLGRGRSARRPPLERVARRPRADGGKKGETIEVTVPQAC